jgi:hypothetical protein
METTIDNQAELEGAHVNARPQFLSVLCILTWICCGLLFISSVWGVIFKPTPEEQVQKIEQMREISPEAAEQMEAAFKAQEEGNPVAGLALNLVALGLSAFGAYMMWQLKRTGFYLYIAGEILPYFGFLMGGAESMAASMGGKSMMGAAIGAMVVFDIAFISMYAIHLKYMKNK